MSLILNFQTQTPKTLNSTDTSTQTSLDTATQSQKPTEDLPNEIKTQTDFVWDTTAEEKEQAAAKNKEQPTPNPIKPTFGT